MSYTRLLLAVVTLSMACITPTVTHPHEDSTTHLHEDSTTPTVTPSDELSTVDPGNPISDLKAQFAALQTKFQVLQAEKAQQDVEMGSIKAILQAVQSSTNATLRSLVQTQAELVEGARTVAFMARKTDIQPVSDGTRITFDQSLVNHGGYYSTSDSIFTCPDDRVYVFVATILSNNRSPTYFAIVQDGAPRGSGYTGNSPNHSSGTEMAIIDCQPGRRVWVMCHSNLVQNQKAWWYHSYFGGFRV